MAGAVRRWHFQEANFEEFGQQLKRRAVPSGALREGVGEILGAVRARGDEALVELTRQYDGVELEVETLRVSERELEEACARVEEKTREAMAAALRNIHGFARHSLREDWEATNEQGARVGEFFAPFGRVGLYVPGGKAPLVSTALMTGGFAQAAGVPQMVAVTPPGADGKVNAHLLYALQLVGAREIYKVGGAQAIGALAYGTERIDPVEKIVGPGNRFVVEAKRQVVGAVSIDLLPGPSEILIVSDAGGNAEFFAADLLAQAEHGPGGEVGFLTTCPELADRVVVEVERQLASLPRADIARQSLEQGGFIGVVRNLEQALEMANDFAPEHLLLVCENWRARAREVISAGAIYGGNLSAVAVGDFLAGPSHTLPTGGAGRSFSGLRADQFQRRTSVVELDGQSLEASAEVVACFAELEGLAGHGRSVELRQKAVQDGRG